MAESEKKCTVENCERNYRAKGFCDVHYRKWRHGEMPKNPRYKICKREECLKPMKARGLCEEHLKG